MEMFSTTAQKNVSERDMIDWCCRHRLRVGVPLHPRSDAGRDNRSSAIRPADGPPVGFMLLSGGQS